MERLRGLHHLYFLLILLQLKSGTTNAHNTTGSQQEDQGSEWLQIAIRIPFPRQTGDDKLLTLWLEEAERVVSKRLG